MITSHTNYFCVIEYNNTVNEKQTVTQSYNKTQYK